MKKFGMLAAAVLMTASLATGCSKGGGDKCEQLVDKTKGMAEEMIKGMGAPEDKVKEAMAEFDKKKPEMLKQCQEAMKDEAFAKGVDCALAAKDMEALSKCDKEHPALKEKIKM